MRITRKDVVIFRVLCVALLCGVAFKTFTLFGSAEVAPAAIAAEEKAPAEVNVYSARKEYLVRPLLEAFTEKTGVKVNFISDKAGKLIARLKAEGDASPADILLTADVGNLEYARLEGVLQPFTSVPLQQKIPSHYQFDAGNDSLYWVGLTERARVIVYNKEKISRDELSTYEDLASERWKGRVAIRSSTNIYNQSLLASFIHANGVDATKEWAENIVANFARTPKGGDTDQIKAVAAGEADVAIVNSYYYGRLLASEDADNQAIISKVGIFFPNQGEGERGTHVNISGGAVTQSAKHKAMAVELLEFLASDEAQKQYAALNHEFPVVTGIESSAVAQSFGEFTRDDVVLSELTPHREDVIRLFDQVGWR